jgi:polygalacturonase
MRKFIILGLLCILITTHTRAHGVYNIMEMGADNTGKVLNTEVIKNAIAKVAEAGGGTIYFPAGDYLTGPIHMRSNLVLHIEAGATLRFSDDFDHYMPFVPSRWEGTNVNNFSPLIYAFEVENITITGRGKIDGQGKKWWDFHHRLYAEPKDYRSKWQLEFDKQNPTSSDPTFRVWSNVGFFGLLSSNSCTATTSASKGSP